MLLRRARGDARGSALHSNIAPMSTLRRLLMIDDDGLRAVVSMTDAIRAVQTVLTTVDPERALARRIIDVANGQLLSMPAEVGGFVGHKLASVAPGNPERGLDRIQGVYTVLDADTLTPRALIDGTELTSIRTPAVSAAVVDLVAARDARRVVVFGSGPQAVRHVEALRCIRPIEQVLVVGRDRARAASAAEAMGAFGVEARVGSATAAALADIVVCATTAREPVLDDVRDDATVVAVGSHEPDARELPGALLGRSQVMVESRDVATSEAGDVVLAIEEGSLTADAIVPMHEIAAGRVAPATDRPRIVKTCGMGWQDLAVAALATERASASATEPLAQGAHA